MSNEYLIQKTTLDALANGAAGLRGETLPLSTETMITELNGAIEDIATADDLIDQITTALEGKGVSGGTGGYPVLISADYQSMGTSYTEGDVYLQYSIDSGSTWIDVDNYKAIVPNANTIRFRAVNAGYGSDIAGYYSYYAAHIGALNEIALQWDDYGSEATIVNGIYLDQNTDYTITEASQFIVLLDI